MPWAMSCNQVLELIIQMQTDALNIPGLYLPSDVSTDSNSAIEKSFSVCLSYKYDCFKEIKTCLNNNLLINNLHLFQVMTIIFINSTIVPVSVTEIQWYQFRYNFFHTVCIGRVKSGFQATQENTLMNTFMEMCTSQK